MVSLQYSDDIDERFTKALEIAIPDLTIKEQLVLRLNGKRTHPPSLLAYTCN